MVIRDEPPFDSRLLQQKLAQAVRLIGKRDAEIAALSKERGEAMRARPCSPMS